MSPHKRVAEPHVPRATGPERSTNVPAGPAEATPVSEIMTRHVVTVAPDVTVDELTSILLERGISGAPVVDEKGRPLGIVSKTDLLRDHHNRGDSVEIPNVELHRGGVEAPLDPGLHVEPEPGPTVRNVMTPLAFALPENASVARASALMAVEGVHRVVVVDDSGTVRGILSSLDVLRWLARSEGYVLPKH
jgi:CBS domain-containing protein